MIKLPLYSYRSRPESELVWALRRKIRAQPLLFWLGIIVMVGSVPTFIFLHDPVLSVMVLLIGLYAFLNAETIEVFRDYLERKGHLQEVLETLPQRSNTVPWFFVGIIVGIIIALALFVLRLYL